MKKKALICFMFLGIIAVSSCKDDVLNQCTKCFESASGDEVGEFCGGPVAVETYETSMENSGDVYCTRQ